MTKRETVMASLRLSDSVLCAVQGNTDRHWQDVADKLADISPEILRGFLAASIAGCARKGVHVTNLNTTDIVKLQSGQCRP